MDRFYIGPYDKNSGLVNSVRPFYVNDKAFQFLNNAYQWRDSVRKRFGSRWLGNTQQSTRLRIDLGGFNVQVGTTNGSGDLSGTVPGITFNVGQRFVIGAETDTVTSGAAGAQPMTRTGGSSTTHTFNIGTGAFVLVGAPANTPVYFFFNTTTTSGAGAAAGVVPGVDFAIGQMFSIGSQLYTVWQNGALKTTGAGAGTYNLTTGAYSITGAPISTPVYFYPAQPVMGFVDYENGGDEFDLTIAFDTQFSYLYNTGTIGWERIAAEANAGAATWSGSNSQFFWGTSYNGINAFDYDVYVINYHETEKMRVLSTVAAVPTWDYFYPQIQDIATGGTPTLTIFLQSARMIIPFKNRLLVFGTWENESPDGMAFTLRQYPFRMRWSAEASPLATDAWRQDIPGQGSGLDNELNEAFTSVRFVKDRLIVFCETATFEVAYQDNQLRPFQLRQINNEYGAESTFSVVGFDRYALAIGDVGVMACTGANVERIDSNIPDEVFKIHQINGGIERVYGIRDYFTEMAYWTFPDETATSVFPYPKKILVYNYATNTWAFNDDSFTAFGYFQPTTGVTWDSTEITWDDDVSWDSGSNKAQFRNVIAGNQEGWTMLIDRDDTTNSPALQITNLTISNLFTVTITAVDYNMNVGDYIYLSGITGTGNLTDLNGTIQAIFTQDASDANTFTFVALQSDGFTPINLAGTYSGGGMITRVSRLQIATKAFNFYATKGYNASINQVNFLVEATTGGKILADWFISNSLVNMVAASSKPFGTGCLLGTSVLETSPYVRERFEATQAQLWHQVYINAQGEYIAIGLYFDDLLMRSESVRIADFKLYAMLFLASRAGNLR